MYDPAGTTTDVMGTKAAAATVGGDTIGGPTNRRPPDPTTQL